MNKSVKRDTPRPVNFQAHINPYASGSVIAQFGNTKVHITAMIEEGVPSFLKGKGIGWLTAEYSMLPAATHSRNQRERKGASGRTQEIQRLIGRSLRSILDFNLLGEKTIMIDCDVLVADGGTRTTAISGAYVALELAVRKLMENNQLAQNPIKDQLAAISVGVTKEREIIADLNYEEDSSCETDMNIVMTASGKFVEVQGTAEGDPFSRDELNSLLFCAENAMKVIFEAQKKALNSHA